MNLAKLWPLLLTTTFCLILTGVSARDITFGYRPGFEGTFCINEGSSSSTIANGNITDSIDSNYCNVHQTNTRCEVNADIYSVNLANRSSGSYMFITVSEVIHITVTKDGKEDIKNLTPDERTNITCDEEKPGTMPPLDKNNMVGIIVGVVFGGIGVIVIIILAVKLARCQDFNTRRNDNAPPAPQNCQNAAEPFLSAASPAPQNGQDPAEHSRFAPPPSDNKLTDDAVPEPEPEGQPSSSGTGQSDDAVPDPEPEGKPSSSWTGHSDYAVPEPEGQPSSYWTGHSATSSISMELEELGVWDNGAQVPIPTSTISMELEELGVWDNGTCCAVYEEYVIIGSAGNYIVFWNRKKGREKSFSLKLPEVKDTIKGLISFKELDEEIILISLMGTGSSRKLVSLRAELHNKTLDIVMIYELYNPCPIHVFKYKSIDKIRICVLFKPVKGKKKAVIRYYGFTSGEHEQYEFEYPADGEDPNDDDTAACDGEHIYMASISNHKVYKFNIYGGKPLKVIGEDVVPNGNENIAGHLSKPVGIECLRNSGEFLVTCRDGAIHRYTSQCDQNGRHWNLLVKARANGARQMAINDRKTKVYTISQKHINCDIVEQYIH